MDIERIRDEVAKCCDEAMKLADNNPEIPKNVKYCRDIETIIYETAQAKGLYHEEVRYLVIELATVAYELNKQVFLTATGTDNAMN